jgi:hypothetical protein
MGQGFRFSQAGHLICMQIAQIEQMLTLFQTRPQLRQHEPTQVQWSELVNAETNSRLDGLGPWRRANETLCDLLDFSASDCCRDGRALTRVPSPWLGVFLGDLDGCLRYSELP